MILLSRLVELIGLGYSNQQTRGSNNTRLTSRCTTKRDILIKRHHSFFPQYNVITPDHGLLLLYKQLHSVFVVGGPTRMRPVTPEGSLLMELLSPALLVQQSVAAVSANIPPPAAALQRRVWSPPRDLLGCVVFLHWINPLQKIRVALPGWVKIQQPQPQEQRYPVLPITSI